MMGKYFGNCTKEIRLLAMYDCAQDCLLLSSQPTRRTIATPPHTGLGHHDVQLGHQPLVGWRAWLSQARAVS